MANQPVPIFKEPFVMSVFNDKGLIEPGAINPNFNKDKDFVSEYIVCGTAGKGLNIQGFLRLKKETVASGSIRLKVEQVIRNHTKRMHRLTAKFICNSNAPFSLDKWVLSSESLDEQGQPISDLSRKESGIVYGSKFKVNKNGKTFEYVNDVPLVANWTIFALIGNFDLKPSEHIKFSMFEDLALEKPNQKLYYRGLESFPDNSATGKFHCYYQLGSGILPFEYSVSENKQLIAATSNCRAYILKGVVNGELNEYLQREFDKNLIA